MTPLMVVLPPDWLERETEPLAVAPVPITPTEIALHTSADAVGLMLAHPPTAIAGEAKTAEAARNDPARPTKIEFFMGPSRIKRIDQKEHNNIGRSMSREKLQLFIKKG